MLEPSMNCLKSIISNMIIKDDRTDKFFKTFYTKNTQDIYLEKKQLTANLMQKRIEDQLQLMDSTYKPTSSLNNINMTRDIHNSNLTRKLSNKIHEPILLEKIESSKLENKQNLSRESLNITDLNLKKQEELDIGFYQKETKFKLHLIQEFLQKEK